LATTIVNTEYRHRRAPARDLRVPPQEARAPENYFLQLFAIVVRRGFLNLSPDSEALVSEIPEKEKPAAAHQHSPGMDDY
jgi:hypothetical protein